MPLVLVAAVGERGFSQVTVIWYLTANKRASLLCVRRRSRVVSPCKHLERARVVYTDLLSLQLSKHLLSSAHINLVQNQPRMFDQVRLYS